MSDLIRDAPLGQIIRFVTRNKYLQYPEEREDFTCPANYANSSSDSLDEQKAQDNSPSDVESPYNMERSFSGSVDLEKLKTNQSQRPGLASVPSRLALQRSVTQADLEHQLTQAAMEAQPSRPVVPDKLDDGTVLVDWYTTDDPANPQNWSFWKKAFVATQINIYTLAFYMGSAIYAPSVGGVQEQFGVSATAASLGLSLYVLAYGLGPMIFSPLSEIPAIGRNPPYMIAFGIFVILCVPTALAPSFGSLIALRFLQGFFGSPCLATGGASLQDMYSLIKLPYLLSLWALAATGGPSLGPIISGFSVTAENWRWSLWEILWLSGPVWLVLFLCLPETSTPNILLRRARRLRQRTGNPKYKSQSEIDQANLSFGSLAVEALWRPLQMMLLDPAIAFTAVYTALIYGIYYSFFEAFPMVYIEMYGFNLGQMGLTFLSIIAGVVVALTGYWAYIYWIVEPEMRTRGLGAPERRLIPALFVCFLLPIGLFIFGWTSNPNIHWIASVIGIGIVTVGIFLIIQCIFLYLPMVYPQYAASLFAGNDLARSLLAAGAVLFSAPMYRNLGIGPGVSLLAGLTAGCILGVFALYYFGDKLRARSRFSAK